MSQKSSLLCTRDCTGCAFAQCHCAFLSKQSTKPHRGSSRMKRSGRKAGLKISRVLAKFRHFQGTEGSKRQCFLCSRAFLVSKEKPALCNAVPCSTSEINLKTQRFGDAYDFHRLYVCRIAQTVSTVSSESATTLGAGQEPTHGSMSISRRSRSIPSLPQASTLYGLWSVQRMQCPPQQGTLCFSACRPISKEHYLCYANMPIQSVVLLPLPVSH